MNRIRKDQAKDDPKVLGDRQEINDQGRARGHTNPTRQRGDRRCHALASASVPRWRVGLVCPVSSVPVSMRSIATDRSLGEFRPAGRLTEPYAPRPQALPAKVLRWFEPCRNVANQCQFVPTSAAIRCGRSPAQRRPSRSPTTSPIVPYVLRATPGRLGMAAAAMTSVGSFRAFRMFRS